MIYQVFINVVRVIHYCNPGFGHLDFFLETDHSSLSHRLIRILVKSGELIEGVLC